MKLNEVLGFTLEVDMGSAKLSNILSKHGDDVHVGFEFECIMSNDTENLNVMGVEEINSYHEVEEYFDIPGRTDQRIHRAFIDWEREDLDSRSGSSYDDWIEAEYSDFGEFIADMQLEPKNGWEDDGYFYTSDGSEYYSGVFSSIEEDILDDDIMGDHLGSVVGDTSIKVDRHHVGVEIITNPIKLSNVPRVLGRYLSYISERGATSDDTGLHINISLDNHDMNDIDWLKVGLFLGEDHVLDLFERRGNRFTRSQLDNIRKFISYDSTKVAGKVFDDVVEVLNRQISREKFSSFNISKGRYVEFRMAGGSGYEDREDDIMSTTLRYVRVLMLGVNPDASRREYIKKLHKLIDSSDIVSSTGDSGGGVLDKLASRILSINRYDKKLLPVIVKKLFFSEKSVSPEIKKALRREVLKDGITQQSFRLSALMDSYVTSNMSTTMREEYFNFANKLLNLKNKD